MWLLVFCGLYFSSLLPNAGIERLTVLVQAPELLAANFLSAADSGWRFFPQRFDLLLIAAMILAGAWGLGRLALAALRIATDPLSAEGVAYALGLGLSLWSLVTLALGAAGLLSQSLFGGLLAAFTIAGAWTCRRRVPAEDFSSPAPRRLAWGAVAVCSPFLLAMLLGSMLPSTDFDVKEYHLQGPKEHYLAGRIQFLPHNVYTSFPFLSEMLSLSAMVLRADWERGALAGKAVLMCFAPLTAVAVFALTRRLFGAAAGWCAVVALLTTPWVYRISIIAYAEGALCCFLALATLACLDWTRATSGSRLALLGLFAGSAAATKYPAVLSVIAPLGAAALVHTFREGAAAGGPQRSRGIKVLRAAAVYSAGVLVPFGPWLLKNLLETGNPVYPLLWSVFGGESFDAATNIRWGAAHAPPRFLLSEPARILPDLFAHARDVAIGSDWQSPLLLGWAPLTLLLHSRRSAAGWLWSYVGWLFLTWLWLTHRIDRFWLPMLPLFAVLAGAGAAEVGWALRSWLRRAATPAPVVLASLFAAITSVCLLYNLGFVTSGLGGYNRYLLDQQAARTQATGESVRLLRAAGVGPEDRVLFVGEAAVFDADFPHAYNTVFDDSLFEQWFGAPAAVPSAERPLRSPQQIRSTLAERGITHVLVNWSEVLRYRLPGSYGFTDFVHPARFDALVDAGILQRTRFALRSSWQSLSPAQQEEIERWAPQLRAGDAFRAIEVFAVPR